MAFRLAELFVEISLKGIAGFSQGLSNVHNQLKAIQTGAQAVGDVGTKAFAAMSIALGGWLRAGFSATAQGNLLALQFTLLHREIASLFLPELLKVTQALTQLVNWFQRLTGAQQENIKRWIEGALVAAGVAIVLPKVIGGIAAVVVGIKALTVALFGLGAASGGVLPALGAIVTAVTALGIGTEVGRNGFSRLFEVVKPLLDAIRDGFSQVMKAAEPLFAVFQEFGGQLTAAFAVVVRELMPAFVQFLEAAIPLFADFIKLTGQFALAGIKTFATVLKVIVDLFTIASRIINSILDRMERAGLITRALRDVEGLSVATEPNPALPRQTVTPVGGQFEDVQSTFRRLQSAALKLDSGEKSEAQKQLEIQQQQLQKQEEIKMAILGLAPAFTL